MLQPAASSAGAYDEAIVAAREDQSDVVVNLVRRGLDPDTCDPSGTTLLMIAASNGNERLLEFLLRSGSNVLNKNKYGETAIAFGSLRGHFGIVRRLIAAGVPPEGSGWSALQYAAFGGHAEVVRLLVTKGANLNAVAPNGLTPLMLAAKNGYPDVVKVLIQAGANRDLLDPKGSSALEIAIRAGNADVADLMREAATTK
jgi:uncharacterized protein